MKQKAEEILNFLDRHVVVRFVLSGGASAVVDLLLLYVLHSIFLIHYLTSAILAFIVAFGVSFTLHKFWTFKSHDEKAHRQMILYLGSSLFGLLLNTLLMYIFVDLIFMNLYPTQKDLNVMLSQVIVGGIVACVSFFLSHKFVFKYKEKKVEINV